MNAALPSTIQNLENARAFNDAGIDPANAPTSIQDPSIITHYQARMGGSLAATQKSLEMQGATAKTKEAEAAAAIKTTQAGNMTVTPRRSWIN
jgi:hypothetical protein